LQADELAKIMKKRLSREHLPYSGEFHGYNFRIRNHPKRYDVSVLIVGSISDQSFDTLVRGTVVPSPLICIWTVVWCVLYVSWFGNIGIFFSLTGVALTLAILCFEVSKAKKYIKNLVDVSKE
jgi:hypothetical protein